MNSELEGGDIDNAKNEGLRIYVQGIKTCDQNKFVLSSWYSHKFSKVLITHSYSLRGLVCPSSLLNIDDELNHKKNMGNQRYGVTNKNVIIHRHY